MERETTARPASPNTDPAALRVGYRSFAGSRTRVLEAGPRDRQATRLVLLHGYCDSADTWRPALAELAATGTSVLAVDLPGFGEADPLRPGAMLPQLDAFVDAVLKEQRQYRKIIVAGNSLGGTMSLRVAQSSRLPIAGVVSIAAPGFVDSWLVRTVGRYPLPLRLAASLPLPIPGFLVRSIAEYVVPRLLYADHGGAAAEQVRRFTSLFPDYRSATTRLEQARQLVEELAEAYQGLDQIRAPLLVVACGKDRLVTPASGERLHALVPHSRLLVRSEWGHCPQLDDPAGVAEMLTYFAAGVTRQSKQDGAEPVPIPNAAAG
ncbi:alpha/beta hydrolase [Amycolatopsis taiwanensis]|uniref:Alpha/beta hydrolase n=2 Tax=Amycolatopsis taiwanensis TaxID=342230 RepID=A0A9W6R092_9PSEU|nr:alpha/beta hydrolase [Amycolatopsis taiwanensis]